MLFPSVNLEKLFETQRVFRDRINYQGADRFEKLILALLVEIGECANEWRGFKVWSKDQEPRTKIVCNFCSGTGTWKSEHYKEMGPCFYCDGTGIVKDANPLLEEYVDGLHFVMECGIEIAEEIQFDVEDYFKEIMYEIKSVDQKSNTITDQFNYIFHLVTTINYDFHFPLIFSAYYHLGEMLGFTWEQIEQAYFEKNAVNHQRQENGY